MAPNQKATALDSFVDPSAPICYGILKPGEHVSDGIPVIKVKNIIGGRILEDDLLRTSPQIHNQYKRAEVNQGDLLLTIRGTTGRVAIVPPSLSGANITQDTARIRVSSDDDPLYVFYALQSPSVQRQIDLNTVGQAVKGINIAEVRKLKIFHPADTEQKKIAQILSTWDKAITTTEQLLANSQQQKKALMQQLLTGKKRLLDENGVRFGGEWREVSLSTICQINPKKSPAPEDGKVSFIAMECVSEDAKLLSSSVREYDEVSKGFTSFADDDVLVAKITPCFENGKGAYVERMRNGIGFGSTEFHVLRSGAKSDSKYLYYLTNTSEFRVRGEANMQGSAGQKRVTTDYLKSLKVTVPVKLSEQQKIASILSIADQEITAFQQKLGALKQEKKALMQQLLTGKRRVIV
ncbi:restriction endonuclease subunit S [Hahella sp. HN01]|uniref:restriction endonuclease subunit S n=1 Tax=Hahella sp. HN01 TaxID=2847262 RepID=UPI001C1EC4EB|nr:restriction endonuclease subunit S [Hahella sp. HN01]MBU6955030.1 restriction endonuclease subunit S [Hahella sp. HN01]